MPIKYSARHRFKLGMGYRSEVIRQVRFYDLRVSPDDQAVNSSNRNVDTEGRSVALLLHGHVDKREIVRV